MASKLQFISELAGHAARTVTHSVDGWKQYLDTAARIYNYTVEDIFAINTGCPIIPWGTIDLWVRELRLIKNMDMLRE